MNILFVHLLNNYTGSPQVLGNILKELSLSREYNIDLLTSKTDGCLSDISNIAYYNNHYKWSNNKFVLLYRFVITQFYIFYFVLLKSKKIDIIYINTLLPFTAALAGYLTHKKIMYHIHEVYINPTILQKIMYYTMEKTATKIITVSQYVSKNITRKSIVIYNAVSRKFVCESEILLENINIVQHKFLEKKILMVASLKKYKGIDIFISLAKKCSGYLFYLVISDSQDEIKKYFLYTELPKNLYIIPQQKNLILYYFDASIVMNLSLPDLWIETFGMTIIEGFQLGTPCIAPDVGGPKEIVSNGKNGFLINPYDEDSIIKILDTLFTSEEEYKKFVINVIDSKKMFSIDTSMKILINEINSLDNTVR